MREILFKAQRISDRKWVEGWLIKSFTGISYIVTCYDHILSTLEKYEVDENTICQFTGLHDKNGNKIWENDIVKDLINGDVYSCKWNHGNCEYELRNDKESFGLGYAALYHYRVIGNIFDNQELLKGGNNE